MLTTKVRCGIILNKEKFKNKGPFVVISLGGKRKKMFWIFLLVVAVVFVVYCLIISNWLKISKFEVSSSKLPKSFDDYKIVLISDLHDKEFSNKNKGLLEKILSLSPDIIVLGGDMHEKTSKDEQFFELLRNLVSIAPVYFSEGNHDSYYHLRKDYPEYIQKVKDIGVVMLDSSVFLTNGNSKEKIILTGKSYHEYTKGSITFDDSFYNVLLYHNPFAYDELDKKPNLMLSGHIHGGFVQLPFLGGIFAPGSGTSFLDRWERKFFFPKYYEGEYGEEDEKLIVSTGLGNIVYIPFRLMRPEIVLVTLNIKE